MSRYSLTSLVLFCVLGVITIVVIVLADNNEITQPHIVFILADDLGWNDVGFRGSNQIPTPNLDALAYSGIILDNYYVTPICTPTRSAIMTGKYPIHTGMQHTVLYASEPRGLPLTEKILPQYLQELGYSTHIVGKWHLGHYKKEFTPLYRGFKSHTGYWTGHQDYFDHTAVEEKSWGLDMRRGMGVAYDLHGQYTTDVITNESIQLIKTHNQSTPLFLYVAHAAVHSGNPYNPLPAPDEDVAKMAHIKDYNRRKYAAMVTKLDESVGAIVKALHKENMLQDTVIIFSTDNGGPAAGFNLNAASNWPLKGVKNTLWEGGVRGAGLLWSPLLETRERIARQRMHVTDWLPTLVSIAGGDGENVATNGDGFDLWSALSANKPSQRTDVLHNIDDIWGSAALTVGNFKVVKGTNYEGEWDGWYGPMGPRDPGEYNVTNVVSCNTGMALGKLKMLPTEGDMLKIRNDASIVCRHDASYLKNHKNRECRPLNEPCLFNITEDPCELVNLAAEFPSILNHMLLSLEEYNKTALPPANLPMDRRADPRLWGYTWTNFGDKSLGELD